MVGRGARIHADKKICVIQDNSGNWLRFQDDWDTLYNDGVQELSEGQDTKLKKELTDAQKEAAKCPKCSVVWSGGDTCAHCGHVRVKRNEVQDVPGEMIEINATTRKPEKYSQDFKTEFYAQLLGVAGNRGYKPGWAFHAYKDKFATGPSMSKPDPSMPGAAVLNWVRSQDIRKAKARAVQAVTA